ncbi:hypothetical protein [Streptomyces xinghaiensis]|nr:hypothetical protein OG463_15025 [Streptomyces xinghaiensis]
MQSDDRNAVAIALIVTAFAGFVALAYPSLIPALATACAAFMAAAVYLKL